MKRHEIPLNFYVRHILCLYLYCFNLTTRKYWKIDQRQISIFLSWNISRKMMISLCSLHPWTDATTLTLLMLQLFKCDFGYLIKGSPLVCFRFKMLFSEKWSRTKNNSNLKLQLGYFILIQIGLNLFKKINFLLAPKGLTNKIFQQVFIDLHKQKFYIKICKTKTTHKNYVINIVSSFYVKNLYSFGFQILVINTHFQ